MSKGTIVIKASRVVKGDLVEVDGQQFYVERIERLRNNLRFIRQDGLRPVLRGRDVKVKVTRDMEFYERCRLIQANLVVFLLTTQNRSVRSRYGTPFHVGQSRVNR